MIRGKQKYKEMPCNLLTNIILGYIITADSEAEVEVKEGRK
jgi:hypothetical protein